MILIRTGGPRGIPWRTPGIPGPPHPNPWHPWDPTTDGNSGRERIILARLREVAEAEGDDMPETTHPTAVAPAVNALPLPFFPRSGSKSMA